MQQPSMQRTKPKRTSIGFLLQRHAGKQSWIHGNLVYQVTLFLHIRNSLLLHTNSLLCAF
uniref:Uncharacterized protein n=1 Tax=Arundo donax TaxID=35708 RepID=A0A0A9CBQ6_ARUDO